MRPARRRPAAGQHRGRGGALDGWRRGLDGADHRPGLARQRRFRCGRAVRGRSDLHLHCHCQRRAALEWHGTRRPSTAVGPCDGFGRPRVWVESDYATWFAAERTCPRAAAAPGEDQRGGLLASGLPSALALRHYHSGTSWNLFDAAFGLPSNDVSDMGQDGSGRGLARLPANRRRQQGRVGRGRPGQLAYSTKPTSPFALNESVNRVLVVGEDVWAGFANATSFNIYSHNWEYLC